MELSGDTTLPQQTVTLAEYTPITVTRDTLAFHDHPDDIRKKRKGTMFAVWRKTDLTRMQLAYLLNVNLRTVRRWFERDKLEYFPPQAAIDVIKAYADGMIPEEWVDMYEHNVDIETWRPVKVTGMIGIEAGIILRERFGPDAINALTGRGEISPDLGTPANTV